MITTITIDNVMMEFPEQVTLQKLSELFEDKKVSEFAMRYADRIWIDGFCVKSKYETPRYAIVYLPKGGYSYQEKSFV